MRRRSPLIDLALCAALSALVASLAFLTKSFWIDEVLSLDYASRSWGGVIEALAGDYHPPLYLWLLKLWIAGVGTSELALRGFQAVQGAALLYVSLALFRRLAPERRFHPFWILLALSSELWLFLPMLRYYALAATLALTATWLLLEWLDQPRRRTAGWLALTYTALLYTDYPTSFAIALHVAWVAVARRELVTRHLALCLAAGAAFLPWLGVVVTQMRRLGEMQTIADFNASPAALVLKVGYSLYAFVFGETIYPFEAVAIAAALGLCAAALLAARQLGRAGARAPLALFLGAAAGAFFTALLTTYVSKRTSFIYTPSRTFYALPLLYLGLGLVYSRLESRLARALLVAPFALLALYGDANWILNRHFVMPVYATPWREVVGSLAGESGVVVAEQSLCYDFYRERLPGSHPPAVRAASAGELLGSVIPGQPVFLITLGRESTESQISSDIVDFLEILVPLESQRKFLPIDESYRRFKARLTGRDSYDAKVTVQKYRWPALRGR